MPETLFSRVDIPNSAPALDYIQAGKADISVVPADIVYIAFNKGTESVPSPHRKLRGMAVMHLTALHWIVRSGREFRSLTDLRGKRVAIGPEGTNTQLTVPLLFEQLGIPSSDIRFERLPYEEATKELLDGKVDSEFILSAFPAEITQSSLATPGTELVSVPGVEISKLREGFPFLRPVTIAAGTYGIRQNIDTIGVNFLFVCREDLEEGLVYHMLSVFFDSLPDLSRQRTALRSIGLDDAPSTPIPLHSGAERFYREHQLFN